MCEHTVDITVVRVDAASQFEHTKRVTITNAFKRCVRARAMHPHYQLQ